MNPTAFVVKVWLNGAVRGCSEARLIYTDAVLGKKNVSAIVVHTIGQVWEYGKYGLPKFTDAQFTVYFLFRDSCVMLEE